MHNRLLIPVVGVALAAATAVLAGQTQTPADRRPNLIVISMDTTRADALSAYGQVPGLRREIPPTTPFLDRIAAEGVRFASFWAHAPTTLNSHASMFTGLDPHQHGIPRNGFPLAHGIPTLATRLREAGWDTIAVVGSAALERAMGLDRGFRVYDDHAPELRGFVYQDTADRVVDRALTHVDARAADAPLFLFVHVYDPHAPYDAPEPWASRFADPAYDGPAKGAGEILTPLREQHDHGLADPADIEHVAARYLGEVAFVDAQIERLVAELTARGVLDHALLVVTADHGEVLSELAAYSWSHGSDVSEGSTRVPLIVRGYGLPVAERAVVHEQLAMSGLPSTLEMALGLEPTLGRPFWHALRPGPVRSRSGWPEDPVDPVFQEATRPRPLESTTSWNNLPFQRSVRAGGYAVVGGLGAPFVLSRPHGAQAAHGDAELARTLRGMLAGWDAAAPPHRAERLSDDSQRALEALGYIDPAAGDNVPLAEPGRIE